MSFLSDYGAQINSVAALVGIPKTGSFAPLVSVTGSAGLQFGATNTIAYNSGSQINGVAFNMTSSGGNVNIRGCQRVIGLGTGTIYSTQTTQNIDIRGTAEINNIGFGSNALNVQWNAVSTDTDLTSAYNFHLFAGSGHVLFFNGFINRTSLANITCKYLSFFAASSIDIRIQNNALTAQSVENILVAADNGTASGGSGSINLSGGTNSGAGALTAAAAAARTSLIAKGYTIVLNP